MASRDDDALPRTKQRFPVDFASEAEFVREVRDTFQRDVDADRHNIEPAREDMQFVIGDQWEYGAKARRIRLKKPVLTVNRLPAFVAQYIGSWLQSDTSIKLLPSRGGTKKIAEIRQGIIRTILRSRQSRQALHRAMENAYICGIGNFGVALVDAKYDVFARDIVLEAAEDPFQVIWDRGSREPTGEDAQHCFVINYMTKDDFRRAYPDAISDSGWSTDGIFEASEIGHGWYADEMVGVLKFWQMREEPVTVGLEAETGDVIDITDMDEAERAVVVAIGDDGQPIIRDTVRRYAECYVMTSSQVLEGPFRMDIPRLPWFRVEGWALQEGTMRHRWGFVRNAKDPQRLHNYWRSILAEELMKSPSSKWLLDATAMKSGLADMFRNAHQTGDNVLFWDSQSDGAKPEFIPPPSLNQAVLTEAGMTVQDIKDVTNKHEASLGVTSNEVSGKAITARQRVSELGDVVYTENMNAALAEAGRVINELITIVYDTNRLVKITGDDDSESIQEINGAGEDATPDITVGKYDITYTTGPSYATRRQEATDIMMTLMNTMPQVGNVVADIIVRNMDIPGAEEIEERLASLLPPGMINPERLPAARRERVIQQIQAREQEQAKQSQIQDAFVSLQLEKLKGEIAEIVARAFRQESQAKREASEIGVQAAKVEVASDANEMKALETGLKLDQFGLGVFEMGLKQAEAVDKRAQDAANAQSSQESIGKSQS